MNYAFLTTLIPKNLEFEVINNSKHNMQDAANALQWHIYEGFCSNFEESINIFNILPIGSFPQYYTKPFIKKSVFKDDIKQITHINIDFCNIKLIRKAHIAKRIFKHLKRWCLENDEEKTLFVYTISSPFVTAVDRIKRLFPSLKVCAIVADLPNMSSLSSKHSLFEKLFNKKLATNSYSKINCIDAFVLLTKQMADYMELKKPFVVMEGISTIQNFDCDNAIDKTLKTILYTGTLHKKFGVLNLVESFRKIDNPDYRLVLCGIGDSEKEIIYHAQKDDRIKYLGQLKREDILDLQKTATVLVNPRQNNEEFTKYSFPSKNLEYLSSGIPLVAYKLDGIPDEYSDYINYVNDNTIDALRDKLIEICEDVDGSALARAKKAVAFVQNEKNSQKQTLKIKRLIETL